MAWFGLRPPLRPATLRKERGAHGLAPAELKNEDFGAVCTRVCTRQFFHPKIFAPEDLVLPTDFFTRRP